MERKKPNAATEREGIDWIVAICWATLALCVVGFWTWALLCAI